MDKPLNAGTCPICGGRWVLTRSILVHHGYLRPGDGFQTDSCFGARRAPYELSVQSCKDYLAVSKTETTRASKWLKSLTSGEVTAITDTVVFIPKDKRGREKDVRPTIHPDHKNFAESMRRLVVATEQRLTAWQAETKRMEKAIKDWPGVQPLKHKAATVRLVDTLKPGDHVMVHGRKAEVVSLGHIPPGYARKLTNDGVKVKRVDDGFTFVVRARVIKPVTA